MKKILIINPFGIGDVLFSTVVIKALKTAYPDCSISCLCNSKVSFLLQSNPHVDEMFFFSRGDWKTMKKKSVFHFAGFFIYNLVRLWLRRFDMVVDLSLVTQYSAIMRFLGVKELWGFNYRNRGRFLTKSIDINGFNQKHVTAYYNDLLALMGITKFKNKLELFIPENEVSWADSFLKGYGINPDAFIVGISPFGGASWGKDAQAKQWPTENFLAVAKHLIEKYNATIILFGVDDEKEALEDFRIQLKSKTALNAAGLTTGVNLGALIKCLDLFIGNDSGLLHMAVALDINSVSIFGPVDEQVYGPVGEGGAIHKVLTDSIECRPCYKNFQKNECQTMDCLNNISVDKVISTVERIVQ